MKIEISFANFVRQKNGWLRKHWKENKKKKKRKKKLAHTEWSHHSLPDGMELPSYFYLKLLPFIGDVSATCSWRNWHKSTEVCPYSTTNERSSSPLLVKPSNCSKFSWCKFLRTLHSLIILLLPQQNMGALIEIFRISRARRKSHIYTGLRKL